MNYDRLERMFNRLSRRKLAPHTYAFLEHDSERHIRVEYYGVVILVFYPDGRVRVNCHNNYSVTTRRRIQELLPSGFGLFQYHSLLYLDMAIPAVDNTILEYNTYIFTDDMLIDAGNMSVITGGYKLPHPPYQKPQKIAQVYRSYFYSTDTGDCFDAIQVLYRGYIQHDIRIEWDDWRNPQHGDFYNAENVAIDLAIKWALENGYTNVVRTYFPLNPPKRKATK